MSERPSYYAVIPSDVRYDKKVCPSARLLFGEISTLANTKGYCYASNAYFAVLYDVEVTTISEWIRQLSTAQHVEVEQTKRGRQIKLSTTLREKPKGASGKAEGGLREKPKGSSHKTARISLSGRKILKAQTRLILH